MEWRQLEWPKLERSQLAWPPLEQLERRQLERLEQLEQQ
jgi:hypothetical protein